MQSGTGGGVGHLLTEPPSGCPTPHHWARPRPSVLHAVGSTGLQSPGFLEPLYCQAPKGVKSGPLGRECVGWAWLC